MLGGCQEVCLERGSTASGGPSETGCRQEDSMSEILCCGCKSPRTVRGAVIS